VVIVLESTTYPGTTAEVLRPILEDSERGLVVGETLFLAFSPERIDPGRTDWTVETTPRVIGGMTPACLAAATAFYRHAIRHLVPVSSAEAAEMTKLLENTFRAINIGLANEVMLMCDKLGLDVWEVVDAASTKPFGFMRFTPGPGLGGHCIPVDPLYLSWRLKHLNYRARFIELATEINHSMPAHWVQKVQDALNDAGKPLKGSSVLVLGITYKRDVGDTRESPALDILKLLRDKGANVSFHDPLVPVVDEAGLTFTCVPDLDAALRTSDCVIIATDHTAYDWESIARAAPLIVDTRRALSAQRTSPPAASNNAWEPAGVAPGPQEC
jgi:UDP-N-acetyl-D-glucosamine dehydrogenase